MSKDLARGAESYETEERQFAKAVELVESIGFRKVRARKSGPVKLIDAEAADAGHLTFWLKVGWSRVEYAAIQFGMFRGPEGREKSDLEFVQFVARLVANIKARGATHALLFHGDEFAIALPIDDVAVAYAEQMRRFPARARNTKSPTMWFLDPRPSANPELTAIVRRRAIPLGMLSKRADTNANDPEVRSRMTEIEARVAQTAFRMRVGERCGWRCVVTGTTLRETLDAAHLPGKDWRRHNEASDGIMVRADIHRLLDAGLAAIKYGVFRVGKAARREYGEFDGRKVV